MRALDRKLLRDLTAARGQIAAIALVVACGIAGFVSMLATYRSLGLSRDAYYRAYDFADVFAHATRAPEAIVPRLAAIPDVARVQTRIVSDVSLDVPGLHGPATARLISIPDRRPPVLNGLYIRSGRYPQAGQRADVLVSEAFASANHLTVGSTIGAVLNGRWQRLRVAGVALSPEYIYEIRGAADILPDNQRFGIIWMGREAMAAAFDMKGAFNDLSIGVAPHADTREVIERVDRMLEPYGGLGAYDRSEQLSNRFITDEISQLRASITMVPTIFLGISAFLLHLLLSRMVGTQRTQIAVLKAFGYSEAAIAMHYVEFALLIVFAGAALGIAAGLWAGWALTRYYAVFYHFPLLRYEAGVQTILATTLVCVASAVAGSLWAVRRAASLPPAEAMRPQAPASFRPALAERAGLGSVFSVPARMLLRNLERTPAKAMLSCIGIALAVAILVVGRSTYDAVDSIIDWQIASVDRQDATVSFDQARPASARFELARLPGVIRVEPFRAVPVRLRFEHRSRRVALIGLERDADLRQIAGRDGRAFVPPADGVLLTAELARALGVRPGESLAVDVLEGSRPTRIVRVTGTVDELLGVAAYMDARSLSCLLQESPTVSGAYVSIDRRHLDAFYAALKGMPSVAQVTLRERVVSNFRSTIARSLTISTFILVSLAAVIAFGVLYNSARISLAERGRELAVMRIMGFTRAEAAVVLLGEQALLTIAAVPLGWALGYALTLALGAAYSSELYRIPATVSRATDAFALLVIAAAAALSGLLVRRELDRTDLVAALKTGE